MTTSGEEKGKPKAATPARIYDYYLGGIHHFPADRHAADELTAHLPQLPRAAQANRAFLHRAIRYLANVGVRQFLDIGAGMPRNESVHTLVHASTPDARVVYVDIDPVAIAHTLETTADVDHVAAICGDLRNPAGILNHPKIRRTIDFTEPIGLLLLGVLPFIEPDDQAYDAATQLIGALPAGSHVVLSHPAAEAFPQHSQACQSAAEIYRRHTGTRPVARDHAAVQRFLAGLALVDPGVVQADEWHPRHNRSPPPDQPIDSGIWVAVGIAK
jgi:hypothetical protein